ncbi:hypothetical protein QYE76_050613 [Lolium multiflorum]|uniref:Uncharacterized protein n=1 Tax=Lolium multiflorum TaxID=4521 RepID=A0AAD8WHG2_LOLMU|nr:hypothetical protein QYE76_050613 [Lolium multiflorum]
MLGGRDEVVGQGGAHTTGWRATSLAAPAVVWHLWVPTGHPLVYPMPSFVDDSSSALPESDRLQRMRDRVAQMEKDMRNTYALAAIVNKKNELVANTERYALTELHKAAESLNFIALNKAEENKHIQERVHALTQLSSADEVF